MWYVWVVLVMFSLLAALNLLYTAQTGGIMDQHRDLRRSIQDSFVFSCLWIITVPILIWLNLRPRHENKDRHGG